MGMIRLLYCSCSGRTYSGISYLFSLHFSHDRWGWAFSHVYLDSPFCEGLLISPAHFSIGLSLICLFAPDMGSLSVIYAVVSSPTPWLVFSLHHDVFWWPWGWAAIKLRLLPGFSLLFCSVSSLPAFAGTNFIIRQRTHLFHPYKV